MARHESSDRQLCMLLVALSFCAFALASGCSGGGDATGEPFEASLPSASSLSSYTQANLDSAAVAWGMPLPEGWSEIDAPQVDVTEACAELGGGNYDGCTVFSSKQIWIAEELSPDMRGFVMLHEMGHVLANRSDHVTAGCGPSHESSQHLMCKHAALTMPTSADYDYLTPEPATPVCAGSPPATATTVSVLHSPGGVWCVYNKELP